jgi:outer membrane protein assembly factor BamB
MSRYLALLLPLLLVLGCAAPFELKRYEVDDQRTPWPYYRGDASATGSKDGTFGGRLNQLWRHRSSAKPAGPLTIHDSVLVFAGSKKKIEFYGLETGGLEGDIKTKGFPETGLIVYDSLGFYSLASRKDRLEAYNLINHKSLWKRPVKNAAPGSILVNNRLLVSSANGMLLALEPFTGEKVWQFEAKGRFVAPASAGHGLIFQPGDHGIIYALSAEDGSEIYRVTLKAEIVSPVAVSGLAHATDLEGNVYGISPDDGSIVWTTAVGGPLWSPPAVAGRQVVVAHSGGDVVALEASTGAERWRYAALEVVRAAPVIVGKFVIVGTMTGRLLVLDFETGNLVDETKLDGAVTVPPVSDGNIVIAVTDKGYITCFGDTYEQSAPVSFRIQSQD